ncbi:carboxypeptidase-like regulatory domain-containing protein [Hymenobacter cellulosilyticus]|uniref:Carboxypeptidase-like regulatory domain-containing protein n=1 Tax=Hymenobacter cellulosilyticus TaxID=2932248 RepID=A0A8T9PYL4_9BACT|nr:carboxypeptidase-like regulatory domain-containing protein [Hymenobacter cellulosilyticus]UOQ70167.1 carboxypeptidase-like regulatory domain-containing protein [Hymenobacter cellulosilyticus]
MPFSAHSTLYACPRIENSLHPRSSTGRNLIRAERGGPGPTSRSFDPNGVAQLAGAAEQVISGRVADKNGQPLPGVTVLVKGTSTGTATDNEGRFQLTLADPAQAVLVISFIGYQTQELRVADQTSFELTLLESATGLEEVVVIGYGTAKRENITTAVASLPNPRKLPIGP